MKPKIYLSKSKDGNFDDIVKLKNLLGKYDCEILEFQGGVYSTDKLLSSEILIIVPPVNIHYHNGYGETNRLTGQFYVGKGQYTELELFASKYPLSPIIIIGDGKEAFLIHSFLDDPEEDKNCKKDWQQYWGRILGTKLNVKIREYLDLKRKQEIKSESIIKTISKENEEISVTIKTNINLLICC